MEKYVLLVALLASLATGELVTKAEYTGSINITCSFYNRNPSTIQRVTSIILSKTESDGTVITASASISYNSLNNFTGAIIASNLQYSYYSYYPIQFLTLLWSQVTVSLDGPWLCEAFGLKTDNRPWSESQEFNVVLADLDPLISTAPEHIESGVTQSLVMECSSPGLAVHGLSEPAEVNFYYRKNGNDQTNELIASAAIDESEQIEATAQDPWAVVSTYYGPKKALHFEIIKESPDTADAGTYTCDIGATKTNSSDKVHLVQTVVVNASEATEQNIRDRVGTEDTKEFFLYACTFENGHCGFNLSATNSNDTQNDTWQLLLGRAAGSHFDHTRQDSSGHYIRAVIPAYTSAAPTVRSQQFPQLTKAICVSFFYYTTGASSALYVNLVGSSNNVLWSTFIQDTTYGWSSRKFNLPRTTEPYYLEFRFQRYNYDYYYNYYYGYNYNYSNSYGESTALLDDIIISNINCP